MLVLALSGNLSQRRLKALGKIMLSVTFERAVNIPLRYLASLSPANREYCFKFVYPSVCLSEELYTRLAFSRIS